MESQELSTTIPSGSDDDVLQRIEEAAFPTEHEETTTDDTQDESPSVVEAAPEEVEEETETEETKVEAAPTEEEDEFLEPGELAAILGVDEGTVLAGDDGELFLQTKIDGETGRVQISELLKNHQTEGHVTRKSQALAEEKREFQAQREAESKVLDDKMAEAALIAQTLEKQYLAEFQSVNWDQLRQTNPAEWSAKRQEYMDKANTLSELRYKAGSILEGQQSEANTKTEAERTAIYTEQAELLQSKLPAWTDPAVATAEYESLTTGLVEHYGYRQEDIAGIADHRAVLVALDALKFRAGQVKTDVAVKKLKKLPKLMKAGKKGTVSAIADDAKSKQKIKRFKRSGNINDAASLIADRI